MADTSPLPLFQTDVKHSPTAGHASPAFTTSIVQKTLDTAPAGLAAAPSFPTASSDSVEKKDQEPISASSALTNRIANGATNDGTANGTTSRTPVGATSSAPAPLPRTEGPTTKSAVLPTSTAIDPILSGSGEKRKAEDEKEDDGANAVSVPKPAPDAIADSEGGEPAAKKAKTDAETVSNGNSAPVAEVGLASAPAPAPAPAKTTSNGDAGAEKNTKRTKREKKERPPVGRTARKTRSQGPVDV